MKKYILITILFATVACNDAFLDVSSTSTISDKLVFENPSLIEKAAIGVYKTWSGPRTTFVRSIYLADTWSDDAVTSDFWNGYWYSLWGKGNIAASSGDVLALWSDGYKIIRSCNLFLEGIAPSSVLSESIKNRLVAEVKVIRAHAYYQLFYNFGEVPLIQEVLPPDAQKLKIPRAEPGGTISFVLKQLDEAARDLPTSVDKSNAGRITKGAALALKARVLLYEGKWQEAASTAKEVMDLGVYSLFDKYDEQFASANNNNNEQILTWQYNQDAAVGTIVYNEKNSLFRGNQISRPTVSLKNAYDANDPRLGYVINDKGDFVKFAKSDNASTNVLIRYAEVLLTYAEAKIEANDIDETVKNAINDVRKRAYGSVYPKVTEIDQTTLRNIVRKERRIELAQEGLRWFDLKRWRIAHGENSVMLGDGGKAISGSATDVRKKENALKETDYLRPIPQTEIDKVGADILKQNPGY